MDTTSWMEAALVDLQSRKAKIDELITSIRQLQAEGSPIRDIDFRMKGTRKEQVRNFLLAHGPSYRKEIVANTGIPVGTVSYVLSDEMFRHLTDSGKWALSPSLSTHREND